MSEHIRTFRCMGSDMRIVIGGRAVALAAEDARDAEAFLHALDARLSRFRRDSELCALNADPRAAVPASLLLRTAVGAARWAAQASGGLVDPTLATAIEDAGYGASRDGAAPASLAGALRWAPARRAARPRPDAAWRAIRVDDAAGLVHRPPGLRLDSGGFGKGLAADLSARRLTGHARFAIDCGGDLRVGGPDAATHPYPVDVLHPITGEIAHTVEVGSGGIATSGIDTQLWSRDGGGFAHHLLDPSTGEPAWTGLVGATALAPTSLAAETLAKAALLSGAQGARRVLARHGGLVVHDHGDVELVGPLRARHRVRISRAALAPFVTAVAPG